MSLSITKNSGSISSDELDVDIAVLVEDGEDILRLCPGGCKKKILFFGFDAQSEKDWGEQLDDMMCIDCKTRIMREGVR